MGDLQLCPHVWTPGTRCAHQPAAPATNRSPELIRAEKTLAEKQRAYDTARDKWESKMAALATARARGSQSVVTPDGQLIELNKATRAELDNLEATEDATREARDRAGKELVEARMKHRELAERCR